MTPVKNWNSTFLFYFEFCSLEKKKKLRQKESKCVCDNRRNRHNNMNKMTIELHSGFRCLVGKKNFVLLLLIKIYNTCCSLLASCMLRCCQVTLAIFDLSVQLQFIRCVYKVWTASLYLAIFVEQRFFFCFFHFVFIS